LTLVPADAVLYGFGANNGNLGDGLTNAVSQNPVQIAIPTGLYVTDVGAGLIHGLATTIHKITGKRELYAWGDNTNNQVRLTFIGGGGGEQDRANVNG